MAKSPLLMLGIFARPGEAERVAELLPDGDERFRVLVDSVKDYAIFMLDADGVVRSWNQGARLIKGYEPAEIVGRRLDVFYTAEDRARHHPDQLLAEAREKGRVEEEGWRVRKDGRRFWADVVITALRNEAGAITGFAKVTRDLTERRNAEEELRSSEERSRLLIDAVEDYAIFMLSSAGRVSTWNNGAQRLFGYQAGQVVGKHFSLFRLPEEVREGFCERDLEIAARDGRLGQERRRVRQDGTQFWANVVLTAVRNEAGELLGFAEVTRDLTERRQLEEERLARARAEEAVRLKDEFLSIASHELKTPLTVLQIEQQSVLERLRSDDPRVTRSLERALRTGNRMAALIDSLLDVGRLASGKLTLKPVRFDLAAALALVVDGLSGSAARAGCALEFEASEPLEGCWDRLRIEQVVMNLVANAIKYAAGTPVTVSLSRTGGQAVEEAVIEIRDRGPGIPEPDLHRIFRRFERAASVRNFGGLGLGLYVSREIVEAHAGSISARNLAEGGAAFTVRLPIRPGGTA